VKKNPTFSKLFHHESENHKENMKGNFFFFFLFHLKLVGFVAAYKVAIFFLVVNVSYSIFVC